MQDKTKKDSAEMHSKQNILLQAAEILSAPLPQDRVRYAGVFEIICIYLSDPLFLKDGQNIQIVLLSYAVYRFINLKLIVSPSIENFLETLRCFIVRRRLHTISNDNGTNLSCIQLKIKFK